MPLSTSDVIVFAYALQVTTKYLNGLIELIHSNLQSNEASASLDNPKKHFQRTLDYIVASNFEGVVTNPPIA
jgi:vacuolar protein sorting-associated protein 35